MSIPANQGFLKAQTATLSTNTSVINLTGDIDCQYVSSGTAIFLNGGTILVEGISGTTPDLSGNSSITLREEYTGSNLTDVSMIAFNTIEGLRDAIRRAREMTDQQTATNSSLLEFFTNTNDDVTINIGGSDITLQSYEKTLSVIQELSTNSDNISTTTIDAGYDSDFNVIDDKNGTYTITGEYINGSRGTELLSYTGLLIVTKRVFGAGTSVVQEIYNSNKRYVRYGSGTVGSRTWTEWGEDYDSQNPQPTVGTTIEKVTDYPASPDPDTLYIKVI